MMLGGGLGYDTRGGVFMVRASRRKVVMVRGHL